MNWLDLSLKLPITDPTWIFLLVLLIILFAPILLTKLRIPHIIGMILAGLAIGEHGFNILVRDSSFELFGKVGVYYIMFLAGLEMNMADFKKNRGKAVALGLLAFIVPISIGMVTNVLLLKYSLITSILLASMYASHTLVAYPIVIRYGISRQRSVSIAVGGTAVTDTLTLLVLAVISGVFKGEAGGLFWLWLVVRFVVLAMLIMILLHRLPGLSIYGVSIAGAAGHNIGQVAAAVVMLGSTAVVAYLPILLIVSVFTGALTGFIAALLFAAMDKTKLGGIAYGTSTGK